MSGKCPTCSTRFIQIDAGGVVPQHSPPGAAALCEGSGGSAGSDD